MKKITNLMKSHPIASSIITSILASMLFLVFLQAPLQYLMVAIPEWLGNMGVTFVNRIYRQAATASPHLLLVKFSALGLGCTLGCLFPFFITSYKTINDDTKEFGKLFMETDASLKQSDIDKAIIQALELSPKSTLERSEQEAKKKKFHIILVSALVFFLIVYIGLYISVPHLLKGNFELAITVIRPYTTEAKINELESEWVQMKTYSDYSDIYQDMEEIVAKRNIDE
jgi:glycosyltransferase involved in cell wall biosynthesis